MILPLTARAVLFTVLLPGVTLVAVPYLLLRSSGVASLALRSPLTIVAGAVGLVAAGVLLYCVWGFAAHGRGTLAPIDPPRTLVVRGLYRHTRNPMYLAVLTVMLSEALFFRSVVLLIYAGLCSVAFHLFVVYGEEPQLRTRFGPAYEDYCRTVPRWGVALRAYHG